MNQLELEEFNSAIARYLPDRQLITFSPAMMVLPKEEGAERGFSNIRNISYLFHEWMHYLHNVSTLHGVSAFVALTELWSAFRHTTNRFGMSSGKINHVNPELFQVKTLMGIFTTARKSVATNLPNGTIPKNVTVTSFAEQRAQKSNEAAHLNISVLIENKDGDHVNGTILLGPGEILESVAFLLEKRFLQRLAQQQAEQPSVIPYHVLTIFAQHIAPSLNEEEILLCGLASLQGIAPANELVKLLSSTESVAPVASMRRQHLVDRVVERMKLQEPAYLAWLDRLDAMFPYPASMGLAVKDTTRYMRRNLEMRKQHPFFEVDLIDEMFSAGAQGFDALMDRLMATHGICAGRQEHSGPIDEIGRDVLFEFAVVGRNAELSEARRVMQASLDFILRHFSAEWSFQPTDKARRGPCPYYTSCVEPTRKERPEDCRTQPWNAVHAYPGALCWYAEGVLILQPGLPDDVSVD